MGKCSYKIKALRAEGAAGSIWLILTIFGLDDMIGIILLFLKGEHLQTWQ